jgi:hypothetical protein
MVRECALNANANENAKEILILKSYGLLMETRLR